MTTPKPEDIEPAEAALETYERKILESAGVDAIAWAKLHAEGRWFVELFDTGNLERAAQVLKRMGDLEYDLTLACEITSELGESYGGYCTEDEWLFGEEAIAARKLEESPTTPDVAPAPQSAPQGTDEFLRCLRDLVKAARAFQASADPMPPDGVDLSLALSKAANKAEELLPPEEDDEEFARIRSFLRTETLECAGHTAVPIYFVQRKNRMYGLDPSYSCDGIVWLNTEDCQEATPDEAAKFEQEYQELQIEKCSEWERVGYKDVWEHDQPFLTRQAAEDYLERQRHNLGEARIYVGSGNRNPEWKFLRRYFKGNV